MASFLFLPHIIGSKLKPSQTFGRNGESIIIHNKSSLKFTHLTPASLPFGIPGIGDDIDGAIQQAPQFGRHL